MFHNLPQAMLERMRYLEGRDAQDRVDGTPRMQRVRQISPETGKFLAILAASAPEGAYLEIGTSAGYSALWLSLACQVVGQRLTAFEILEEKAELARETFKLASVEDRVSLVVGDALQHLGSYKDIAFCFLDAEKEIYGDCYEAVVPNMVSGGLLAADNAIDHRDVLEPVLNRALNDDRVDALVVPIGNGILLCRRR